jgi:predicted phage terminase large subunit-like protein
MDRERRRGYFVLEVCRQRVDFTDLVKLVLAKAAIWHPNQILVEDAASGIALNRALEKHTNLPFKPVSPQGDKVSRASAVAPLFESGRVFVPTAAPWLKDWLEEMISFPSGSHDDQVDSIGMALRYLYPTGGPIEVINSPVVDNSAFRVLGRRHDNEAASVGRPEMGSQEKIDLLEDIQNGDRTTYGGGRNIMRVARWSKTFRNA